MNDGMKVSKTDEYMHEWKRERKKERKWERDKNEWMKEREKMNEWKKEKRKKRMNKEKILSKQFKNFHGWCMTSFEIDIKAKAYSNYKHKVAASTVNASQN